MLEGPNREGFISHFLLRTPQQLAATIRIKASIGFRTRHQSIRAPTPLRHKVGKDFGNEPSAYSPTLHPLIDRQNLEIPVKIAIINSDLISVVGRLGKVSHQERRCVAEEAIPAADHVTPEADWPIMHECNGDNLSLMFNDESVSGGQVGFRHHLIEDSQTLWVTVRLVDIRLEREMKWIVKKSFRDNACHFRNICTRCGPTLHSAPPLLDRIAPRNKVENLTSGRRLSYYAMISQETLSVRGFFL